MAFTSVKLGIAGISSISGCCSTLLMSFRRFSQLFRHNELRTRISSKNTTRPQSNYGGARKKAGPSRPTKFILSAAVVGGAGFVGYETSEPFRHTCVASVRCYRVASEFYSLLHIFHFSYRSRNVMKERLFLVSYSNWFGSLQTDLGNCLQGSSTIS